MFSDKLLVCLLCSIEFKEQQIDCISSNLILDFKVEMYKVLKISVNIIYPQIF